VNSTGNEMTRSGNGRDRDWLAPADTLQRPAGEVFGFSGGAASLRASALVHVGLFDESLFMYYEDTELSWRLRRAGYSVGYAPDAVARHAHAASSGTRSELFRFHNERNRVLVSVKTAPAVVAATALARTAVATLRSSLLALRSGSPDARAAARGRRRSLAAAVRLLPAALGERRRIDREATVPRSEVARLLVAE
jgi:GT2 family glycosyltransferase